MANPIGTFSLSVSGLTVTDANNFVQLRNGSTTRAEILEVRVFQTSDNSLMMNAIQLERGTGGTGGDPITEYEEDIRGSAPVLQGFDNGSSFTGQVGTLDMVKNIGWNILQEMIWVPTPRYPFILMPSDELGISLLNTDSLTIGCSITWEEYGV